MQADCLAAALLVEANRVGIIHVAEDVDDMYGALAIVADAESWSTSGDHGDIDNRFASFERGVGGVAECIGPTSSPDLVPRSDASVSTDRASLITPSGNIRCASIGLALKCSIKSFTFASNCNGDGMPLITMYETGKPTADSCAGTSLNAWTFEPTQYGDKMNIAGFVCAVAESGLTCTNPEGHGFKLAKATLELY